MLRDGVRFSFKGERKSTSTEEVVIVFSLFMLVVLGFAWSVHPLVAALVFLLVCGLYLLGVWIELDRVRECANGREITREQKRHAWLLWWKQLS